MKLGKFALLWIAAEVGFGLFLLSKASASGNRYRFRAVITPGLGQTDADALKTTLFQWIPGVQIESFESSSDSTAVVFTRPLDKPPSSSESRYGLGSYMMRVTAQGPA
jgi:hypothetical protein